MRQACIGRAVVSFRADGTDDLAIVIQPCGHNVDSHVDNGVSGGVLGNRGSRNERGR